VQQSTRLAPAAAVAEPGPLQRAAQLDLPRKRNRAVRREYRAHRVLREHRARLAHQEQQARQAPPHRAQTE